MSKKGSKRTKTNSRDIQFRPQQRANTSITQKLEKPRLLWIGDAGCHTGFATVTHNILNRLADRGWDVHVLAINYYGDPHDQSKLRLYPASIMGDIWGVRRLKQMMEGIKPHVVCILNDPWIIADYTDVLNEYPAVVKLCYTPIDSPNVDSHFVEKINTLDGVIAYTAFGAHELQLSGLKTRLYVAPHGIDTKTFYPIERNEARKQLNGIPEDWFIVGCVGRNQPRKRLDLAMQAFSIFAKDKPEAKFFYHGAVRDVGWNVLQLADWFGIADRLMITDMNLTPQFGVSTDVLNKIYNSFDVHLTTPLGEGWGLCNMEVAAARKAQIVPDWSALGEWLQKGAILVPCTGIQVNTGGINTVGGVIDVPLAVKALNDLYHDAELRNRVAYEGYENVTQVKYSWDNVAQQFDGIFREVAREKAVDTEARSK